MPPIAPAASQESASVEETFYATLENLSKRYEIAFVAEGTPFPTSKDHPNPSVKEGFVPEDEAAPGEHSTVEEIVQNVVARFDYFAVRQGSLYLLMKRYSNPEDLPDVTPDECRNGLKMLAFLIPRIGAVGATPLGHFQSTPEGVLAWKLHKPSIFTPTEVQWARLREDGVPLTELHGIMGDVWATANNYYFQTHYDWIQGTLHEMDTRLPYNPYFHWKTIDQARVFGYDTLLVDFIPMSDAQRVFVPPYNATLLRPNFTIRNDFVLPVPDPTDPAGLSEQAKQVLDSNGKASHAISLAQAVTALNRRASNSPVYSVEEMLAKKRVTLVGVEAVPPPVLMQALADVYGLHFGNSRSATILTAPQIIPPTPFDHKELALALIHVIPAPLYRAFHIHIRPAQQADMPLGPGEAPAPGVTLDNYLARGVAMHSMVVRMFRYLAQQKLKPQSSAMMPLSRLGERAHDLFELARMMRVYADLCGLADCPIPPPYYIASGDFIPHVTLYGGYFGAENTGAQVMLSFVYSNESKGEKYGPVPFFDYRMPPGSDGPIQKSTVRGGRQP